MILEPIVPQVLSVRRIPAAHAALRPGGQLIFKGGTALAKILAEPNLTTLSGQQAKFLAGGEFPVPVPADFGSIGIEYKEFGVGLQFIPGPYGQGQQAANVRRDEEGGTHRTTAPPGALLQGPPGAAEARRFREGLRSAS